MTVPTATCRRASSRDESPTKDTRHHSWPKQRDAVCVLVTAWDDDGNTGSERMTSAHWCVGQEREVEIGNTKSTSGCLLAKTVKFVAAHVTDLVET
jgi:hypothetical protein